MTAVAVAILAFLIASPDPSAKHSKVGTQHQTPAGHAEPQPNATAPVKEIHSGEAENYRGEQAGDASEKTHPLAWPPDPWPDRFQGATAVFTGLYFVATVLIYCEMRRFNRSALSLTLQSNRLTRESLAESKKEAEAAQESATATTSAAATSKRALELSERADVLVEAIDLIDPGYDHQRHSAIGGTSICRITVRNYGRTRAENLTVACFLVVKSINPEPTIVTSDTPMVLGAGKPFELQFLRFSTYVVSQAAVKDITSGNSQLHIKSEIGYDDVFGHHYQVTCLALYDWTSGGFRLTQFDAG